MGRERVDLSRARYEQLLECERQLQTLLTHGVDDWEGYVEAMRDFNGEEEYAQIEKGEDELDD